MRVCVRLFMLPVAALMLMSFDTPQREETEDLLMPEVEMFGLNSSYADVEAIKSKALKSLGCDSGLNVAQEAGLLPFKCPNPLTRSEGPVSSVTLNVIKLNAERDRSSVGFRCLQREYRELDGDGIGYTQSCSAHGFRYEIQFSMYYGLEV